MGLNINWFGNTSITAMLLLPSFLAGASAQVFKINKIPAASRHLAFFVLTYTTFIFVFLPLSPHAATPSTTLVLSFAFIIVYLAVFGIYMGIKAITNIGKSKTMKYDKIYKKQ